MKRINEIENEKKIENEWKENKIENWKENGKVKQNENGIKKNEK